MRVDGKGIANAIYGELRVKVSEFEKRPKLVLIKLADDPVTESYVAIKKRSAEKIGVEMFILGLRSEEQTEEWLRAAIDDMKLFYDGIVVQLPLPRDIDVDVVLSHIPPNKDIDALGEKPQFTSPIVLAVEEILKRNNVSIEDKKIVVVGRGRLVGKPLISWLRRNQVEPVVLEEDSGNIEKAFKEADIIISGAGSPHFIKQGMIKNGVVLIDAGTSESGGEVVGDIDPECENIAGLFTPVPGGVGPIVVAKLFENLILAASKQ